VLFLELELSGGPNAAPRTQHEERNAEAVGWQNSYTKLQNGENKYNIGIHTLGDWKT
jgi:hypothetical protein